MKRKMGLLEYRKIMLFLCCMGNGQLMIVLLIFYDKLTIMLLTFVIYDVKDVTSISVYDIIL